MQIPKSPPDLANLFATISSDKDKFASLVRTFSPLVNGKYLHWDDLLHRTPPEGLSHEEWWLGIKLARITSQKQVPFLVDKSRGLFTYTLVDPIPEMLHEIDLRVGGRTEMPSQVTNPETRDRYYIESLIEEAISSSQLEGASTTRRVAREMIRSGRNPRGRSETMIINNYYTMKMIADLKTEKMTPDHVLRIHERVTRGTLDDPAAEGRFRSPSDDIYVGDQEGQVLHRPPHSDTLKERMDSMCEFFNRPSEQPFIHPVLKSIILHFWMGYDHPFVDGNGRCARALFYWSMLHQGYWLCEYISISQILLKAPARYGLSFLHTETDGNDLTYFLLYHLNVIRRSIDELHKFIRRRTKQLEAFESQVKNLDAFNHRQRDLLSHAVRHPGHQYTINAHKAYHGVVYQTARTDLLDLRNREMLSVSKVGRKWVFTAPEDLETKLSGKAS